MITWDKLEEKCQPCKIGFVCDREWPAVVNVSRRRTYLLILQYTVLFTPGEKEDHLSRLPLGSQLEDVF